MPNAPKEYRTGHAGYVSEFTRFIDHFLDDHPDVAKSQKIGWDIYWDRPVDLDALTHPAQEDPPTLSYYFPNSTQGIFHVGSHH